MLNCSRLVLRLGAEEWAQPKALLMGQLMPVVSSILNNNALRAFLVDELLKKLIVINK